MSEHLRRRMVCCVSTALVVAIAGCGGTITLPDPNQRPIANPGVDLTTDIGQRVTLDGLGSTDADDDPLTFSWQQRSGPAVTLDGANTTQPSFVPVEDGVYEFALTVTDGRGGSDTSIVRVFVGDVDPLTCPRADAGTDQTASEGAAVKLRGCNSADPSGDPLTFDWFQTSGPQVSISGIFTCGPNLVAPQVTGADIELEFELTVTNEQGCSDTDRVGITVRDRDPDDPCNGAVCQDDALFCNGVESCVSGQCVSSGDPCAVDETCNEAIGSCDAEAEPICTADEECDDGVYCNGEEQCIEGQCMDGVEPCLADEECDEVNQACLLPTICLTDAECDDSTYCNGQELCIDGQCVHGEEPCEADEGCDEENQACFPLGGCPEPTGLGGFTVVDTSIGTTNIALDQKYFVEFDEVIDESTFTTDVVQVIEAGPDNILNTPDDVAISPIVTLSLNHKRITVYIAPSGVLIAGRRYRVTVFPGCMRASGPFGEIGLDGEYSGMLPSGNGQQGGSFVQDFTGIEQRAFATNTGGIRTLAIRPTDGSLYGAGLAGSFGPITFETNVGNDLLALAELGVGSTTAMGAIFTSDGDTLLVTTGSVSGEPANSSHLQRVPLSGEPPTSEQIANSTWSMRAMRRVPPGFSGPTVAPGEIVGIVGVGIIKVLDLSTTPAQQRLFGLPNSVLTVRPFHFNSDGTLTAFGRVPGIPLSAGLVAPTGAFTPLLERDTSAFNFDGNAGTFRLPDGSMVGVNGLDVFVVPPSQDGRVAKFSVLASSASEMVLSLDRGKMYIAMQSDNRIVEFSGFPTE